MKRILYVGMDVHLLCIVICVMDQQGKTLSRSVIETSTQAVRDFFASLRGEIHVTFEEGTLAFWLYDVVEPLVDRLIVCNPKHNKKRMGQNRNDRIDAATLAELLRLNAVKAVYQGEHGTRTLKHLMRSYELCLPKMSSGLEIVELTADTRKLHDRSATPISEVF